MVKYFDEIPTFIPPWAKQQKLFWVATAPLTEDGHVNVSPKALFADSFTFVNSKQLWYEDLTGSGVETISHLRENGRITVMFIAFDGPPRICRLFGKGTVYEFGTPEYDAFLPPEKRQPGSRSVIFVDVYKVSSSCGYSIPFYSLVGYRTKYHGVAVQLQDIDIAAEEEAFLNSPDPNGLADTKSPTLLVKEGGLKHYWKNRNAKSLDGLPGLQSAAASQARFHRVDLNVFKNKELQCHASPSTTWISPQSVVAFTLGALTSVSVLRLLQQQHLL